MTAFINDACNVLHIQVHYCFNNHKFLFTLFSLIYRISRLMFSTFLKLTAWCIGEWEQFSVCRTMILKPFFFSDLENRDSEKNGWKILLRAKRKWWRWSIFDYIYFIFWQLELLPLRNASLTLRTSKVTSKWHFESGSVSLQHKCFHQRISKQAIRNVTFRSSLTHVFEKFHIRVSNRKRPFESEWSHEMKILP